MRINQLGSYYTLAHNFQKQNMHNNNNNIRVSKTISFGLDEFGLVTENYMRHKITDEKNAEIKSLIQGVNTAYENLRHSGGTIYGNAKRAIRQGRKSNFENYKNISEIKGTQTKLVFGPIMQNGFPKTISYVEPDHSLNTLQRYEFEEGYESNPFAHYTMVEYTKDGETRYEMVENNIISVTQSDKNSDTEKCIMPYKNGYNYVINKVSDDGTTPETVKSLNIPNVKKGEGRTYAEYNDNGKTAYHFEPKSNLWVKE